MHTDLKAVAIGIRTSECAGVQFIHTDTQNMFLRIRKSNLSLERAVYKPAEKDTNGKIVVHPVRTTEYIGSMSAYAQFSKVPIELLDKLDDGEKAELKKALTKNEPKPNEWLNGLPAHLQLASTDLARCVALATSPEARKTLEAQVKLVEQAWNAFFREAQNLGLKRKVNRIKKPQATTTKLPSVQDPT